MPPERDSRAAAWLPLLYDCLHDLASRALSREPGVPTLQPTALVHEAYLRLVASSVVVEEEQHFLALAARTVRRVLVDHARARHTQKRGGPWQRVTLDPTRKLAEGADPIDLLALDEALSKLERANERAARVVELLFFSGLSIDETADALSVSPSTVDVDWRFARAWLARELEEREAS